jgi:hypothetical protein
MAALTKRLKQCKSCPWRVDCVPDKDIPNYVPELARKLDRTCQSGLRTLGQREMHVMACHYSKPGEEFPCAGWLHNQLGPGNNIAVRLRVITGSMPVSVVDGDQHERYEDTLPCDPKPQRARKRKR